MFSVNCVRSLEVILVSLLIEISFHPKRVTKNLLFATEIVWEFEAVVPSAIPGSPTGGAVLNFPTL